MNATAGGPTATPGAGAGRRRLPLLHRILLALLLVFVACETAVRIADWRAGRDESYFLPPPFSSGAYLAHPSLGVVLKPGWVKDHGDYRYRINALGMRGPEVAAEKPAGVFRILCIGVIVR